MTCAASGRSASWGVFGHDLMQRDQSGFVRSFASDPGFYSAAWGDAFDLEGSYSDPGYSDTSTYFLHANTMAVLVGSQWNKTSITYSFPDKASDYGWFATTLYPETRTFGSTNFDHQQAVRHVLEGWSPSAGGPRMALTSVEGITNLSINFNGHDDANIRVSTFAPADLRSHAYYPNVPTRGGDVWLSKHYKDLSPGGYGYHTILHEIGHALGLRHGHEAAALMGGAIYSKPLSADRDSLEFSVMTYRSYVGQKEPERSMEEFGSPQTFMMYDIAALQRMYGADFTANGGNTVYSWSTATGETFVNGTGQGAPGGGKGGAANRIFLTIWDGGGNDTYDFSNYATDLMVDLTPGRWSKLSDAQTVLLGSGAKARANVFNALQYNGDARSLIENTNGGSGQDKIRGNATSNRINGNQGYDQIKGMAGNDTLYGGNGDDTVNGGYGNDLMDGGAGSDTLSYAGAKGGVTLNLATGAASGQAQGDRFSGFENITGSGYNDNLTGSAEDNVLHGSAGSDTLRGGAGHDRLSGDGNDDVLYGEDGNDTLLGGSTNDSLDGGTGDDVLDGGADNDTLRGGTGNDTYHIDTTRDRVVENAGEGYDRIVATIDVSYLADNVEDLLLAGTAVIGTGNTLGNEIAGNGLDNGLSGLGGDDWIFGAHGHDKIAGNDGDDILSGDEGNDTLWGGSGNDKLYGDFGNDQLWGESGNDTLNGAYGNDFIAGNQGTDTLNGEGGNDELWGGTESDTLNGGDENDFLAGETGSDLLRGGNGNDTLYGGTENDELLGEVGADTLYGEGGSDILIGGTGNDLIAGGTENDLLSGEWGSDTLWGGMHDDTLWGGTHDDTLWGGTENDFLAGETGADSLHGQDGSDTLWGGTDNDTLTGGAGNDWLAGESGDDVVEGGDGDDIVGGQDGNDGVFGGNGSDALYGEAGHDFLNGGTGNDTLYGGASHDRFVFDANSGVDEIKDFEDGDVIQLTGVTFSFSDASGLYNRPVTTGYNSGWGVVAVATMIKIHDGRTIYIDGIRAEQLKGGIVNGAWEWHL